MQMSFDLDLNDDIPNILLSSKRPSYLKNLPDDFIILDIETTGFSPVNDSIIEISALKVINNKIAEEFSSLVKPKKKISSFISNLTGITPEMTLNAPEINKVLKNFCNFIGFYPLVGHNVRFDLGFINKNLTDVYNKTLSNDYSDTLSFAKNIYKNLDSYKLTNIAKYLNIDTQGAHRALNDCYITYKIIIDMKNKIISDEKALK